MNEREELAALRRLAELEAKANAAPASVTLGATLREVPRQFGLTARYGLEGFGQSAIANLLGLPQPQNANERVIGDASRTLVAAGGLAAGVRQIANRVTQPVVAGIADALASNLPGQAGSAIGAGLVGGSVREAGGGPTEQFIASIIGGVGGGLAVGAMQAGLRAARTGIQKIVAPKDIQGLLTVELQKAGIDWNALSNEARRALVKDAERALYRDEPLDPQALARLAAFRNIGATPTRGTVTQDPTLVTREQNLRRTQANMQYPAGPNLPAIENANAKRVIETLGNVEPSPADATAAGQLVRGQVQAKDAGLKAGEDALYREARAGMGRDAELDRGAFLNEVWGNLKDSNRAPWLPEQVKTILNTLERGDGEFTIDTIDKLKTILATASRATQDGNVKAAISNVRSALENVRPSILRRETGSMLPVAGAQGARQAARDQVGDAIAASTLDKFDAARTAARGRRTWQESARFIEDALDPEMDPAQFTKRHIVNGNLTELVKLRKELGGNGDALAATRKQLLGYILERGKVDSDITKFTSAGLKAAFDQLGKRKLGLFFTRDELQRIESAINVGRYMQAQPTGSAVNNSNSAAMLVGKVLDSILSAGMKAPLVRTLLAEPLTDARIALQARSTASIPNALVTPTAPQPFPVNALLPLALLPSSQQ